VTARQQLEWLVSKSEALGFEIPPSTAPAPAPHSELDVRITNRQLRTFTKGRNESRRVTVATVTFDGHLVIRDADKVHAALVDGVGPAKAYGCGRLTLAPLLS
jgi:CRISPR system Cascade subunit CasE